MEEVLSVMAGEDFGGASITIPLKEKVGPVLVEFMLACGLVVLGVSRIGIYESRSFHTD